MNQPRCHSRRRHASRLGAALLVLVPALLPGSLPAAVVVELFTSQGCSSCPPADRLLTRLGSDPELSGEVIPLAFHVDYWNYIGWRDPFSDAAWSRRQRAYLRTLGGNSVYTPQAVIGGRRQCLGGDAPCIRAAVEAAAAQAEGQVTLAFGSDAESAVGLTVAARAPAGAPPLDVMVAVFEKGLETPVGAGENARKTLRNDFVVRRLQRAFRVAGGESRLETVSVPLARGWRRANLGVAVFLQDPKSQRILGAAAAALPGRQAPASETDPGRGGAERRGRR
jgi:hypothetical protein